MKIFENIKWFLKQKYVQEALRDYNFETLYSFVSSHHLYPSEIGNLTETILSTGINPLEYLKNVPCHFLTAVDTTTHLEIPSNIESIGECAFYFCSKLETVRMAEGVTNVMSFAFKDCKELTAISLPSTLLELGSNLFSGCPQLKEITFRGTLEQWASISKGEMLRESSVEVIKCLDGEVTKSSEKLN